MGIILNIDTAVETASVCLSEGAHSLQFAMSGNQKDHASWLHPAIQKVLADEGMNIKGLDAIAISIGPGSYTGLRVGLSAAKGLCFALGTPLIVIHTLEMMAFATKDQDSDLFCPLIDARRMEVFMAIYDKTLTQVVEPKTMIINPDSFDSLLALHKIVFSGNGSSKVKKVIHHPNAVFSSTLATAADMIWLSEKYYNQKKFADLAYTEPLYIKEFYSPAR
jgi:tRNA threonylcarbamoyladenosine biosynthesis protein TsaB